MGKLMSLTFSCCNQQNMATRDSQPGWIVSNDQVEVFVTRRGGHMAPVVFYKDSSEPIQPYYISPWQNENIEVPDPVLEPLRGDFFCMPFGANLQPYNGEQHYLHGDTARREWEFAELGKSDRIKTITFGMDTVVRKGHVTKKISIVEGQNVLYITHVLGGFEGKIPIGHHAILSVPDKQGSLKVSVGNFDLGMTDPTIIGDPVNREYQSLAIGETFESLEKVPLIWKAPAFGDCSSYPQRTGFTDVLYTFKKPSVQPAWTTACNEEEGYLWFAFKNASILPTTAFWIENKGRHGQPWNGRNRCLGLEETCAYCAEGIASSIEPNILTEKGFPTCLELSPDEPTNVYMIQGCARVPENFGKVKDVEFMKNSVHFISETGLRITVKVNYDFIKTGKLI